MPTVDYTAFHSPVAYPERYSKLSLLHLIVEFPLYGVQDIRDTFKSKSNGNRLIPTYICLLRNDSRLPRKDFKRRTNLHASHIPDADAQVDDDFQKERAWLCCNRFDLGARYVAGVGACPAIKRFPSYNTFASLQLLVDAPYMGQEAVENLLTNHNGSYHDAYMAIIALQLKARTGAVKAPLDPVKPFLRPSPCFTDDGAGEFVKELMWTRVHWLTYLPRPKKRNNVPQAGLQPAVKQLLVAASVADDIPTLPPDYFTTSEPASGDYLGKGAEGDVYRMTTRQPVGLVAVKIQTRADDEDTIAFKKKSIREWRIQQRLKHPNLVTIYNCFNKDGGRTTLSVMALMDFGTLQTFVISRSDASETASLPRPVIPEGSIAWICKEVCLGLDFIHQLGLRHGDVKAGNILLNTAGRVKLCDFGHVGEAAFGWPRVGTPEYWPPEAMLDERQQDVWALGMCTRFMITGGLPPPRNVPKPASMYGHLFDPEEGPHMKERYLHQLAIATTGMRLLVPVYVDMNPDLQEFMFSTLETVPAGRLTTAALLELSFVRKAHARDELIKLISDITRDGTAVATGGISAARMRPSAKAPRADTSDEPGVFTLEGPHDAFDVEPFYCPGAFTTRRAAEVPRVGNYSRDCIVLSIAIFIQCFMRV